MITLYCPFDVHLNRNQISCKHLKQVFLKSNVNIIPLTRRTNLHKNHVFSFTFSFSQNILQSNDDVLSRKSFPLVPKLLIWFSNDVVFQIYKGLCLVFSLHHVTTRKIMMVMMMMMREMFLLRIIKKLECFTFHIVPCAGTYNISNDYFVLSL